MHGDGIGGGWVVGENHRIKRGGCDGGPAYKSGMKPVGGPSGGLDGGLRVRRLVGRVVGWVVDYMEDFGQKVGGQTEDETCKAVM